jgi:ELWxxDGT repeat protein
MVSVGSTAFFAASSPASGVELWKSDGTTAGTVMVKDLIGGPTDSFPNDLTNVNGVLYFSAINPVGGRDLWKSDGTETGTIIVASGVLPDSLLIGEPPLIASIGNNLFFRGSDAASGGELWISNLTTGVTNRLVDINPGVGNSDPGSLTVFNGDLYFAADDGTSGRELWRTNSSTLVTTRVADIWPGVDSSEPNNLEVFGNTLYFAAMRPAEGIELWATNGTTVNLIRDIVPGVDGSLPSYLTEVNGTLLFAALSAVGAPEIWKTDGTSVGTVRVFNGFTIEDFIFEFGSFTTIGNSAYFTVITDSLVPTPTITTRAWKSDGTNLGTVEATELTAGVNVTGPQEITRVGSLTYYVGTSPTFGSEIFVTNQAPTNIVLSSNNVAENSALNTVVGSFSTVDPNAFDSFNYSLVAGTGSDHNALFSIVGNQLRVSGSINFEATPSLSIRVRTTDSLNPALIFERTFSIVVVDLPEVLSTVVAGSNALGSQRSAVRSIVVTFDGPVDITGNPFVVRQRGGSTPLVTTGFTTSTNVLGQTVATITFSGALTRASGALLDGNYELTIDAANVRRSGVNLDGDQNGVAGGDYVFGTLATDRFFAFFGDINGDRNVRAVDINEFRVTNGKSLGQLGYNPDLDFDGNNSIRAVDINEFRRSIASPILTFV